MTTSCRAPSSALESFRHEAMFYRGLDDLVDRLLPFVLEGVRRGESVLVAMLPDRLSALRDSLGDEAELVSFVDMEELGRNPARIIPAWHTFLGPSPGRQPSPGGQPSPGRRGVGEPIWSGRRPAEIIECRLHESLLNVAFGDGPPWQLMCPYDVDSLPGWVVEDAMRTHPLVGPDLRTADYAPHRDAVDLFAAPLSTPPPWADEIRFGDGDLTALRGVVTRLCDRSRLTPDAIDDLILAAHELASNSLKHGGGGGLLRAWTERDAFVLEVRDSGTITDPLVGRHAIPTLAENGRGVWMANQLCDLVQVRSTPTGTVVRLLAWL